MSWLPGIATTGLPNERRKRAARAVRQVARGDDELGLDVLDQARERLLDFGILACTRVQIGYMEEAPRHDRMRL
jgi:hypothetical protein